MPITTAKELRAALKQYDEHSIDPDRRIHNFGVGWWDSLTEPQRKRYRHNSRSCWGDLQTLPDDELMMLWVVFLM